jgi:Putative zinc-finger
VTCLEVRELLPEHAIGVLGEFEHERIQRHLQTCAGCRKEAGDLGQAASTLAFALAPVPVPEGLGDRVVARVRRAAGAPGTRRRARTATVALVAAALVFASLGWGAVMAGRAERFADRAAQAQREQAIAIEHFQQVLGNVIPGGSLSDNETHIGQLAPVAAGTGGGFALQLVSPRILDFVMVIVNGLDEPSVLPLRVQLVNDRGRVLRAGRIDALDANGGAEVYHQFRTQGLGGFTTVNVVDTAGRLVLSGTVDQSS